jgi:hypothetical protein
MERWRPVLLLIFFIRTQLAVAEEYEGVFLSLTNDPSELYVLDFWSWKSE